MKHAMISQNCASGRQDESKLFPQRLATYDHISRPYPSTISRAKALVKGESAQTKTTCKPKQGSKAIYLRQVCPRRRCLAIVITKICQSAFIRVRVSKGDQILELLDIPARRRFLSRSGCCTCYGQEHGNEQFIPHPWNSTGTKYKTRENGQQNTE